MGLDQFAHAVDKNGEKEELSYWRKHPNLQGWMEELWVKRGCPDRPNESDPHGMSDFNCVPLELTLEDLQNLEDDINNQALPSTAGFFFGSYSDDYYQRQDLDFIKKARKAIDNGQTVVYNSWW